MTICLMANIPNNLIIWGIKYIVKSHCKFHHTQACTKMATIDRNIVYNEIPKLITELY